MDSIDSLKCYSSLVLRILKKHVSKVRNEGQECTWSYWNRREQREPSSYACVDSSQRTLILWQPEKIDIDLSQSLNPSELPCKIQLQGSTVDGGWRPEMFRVLALRFRLGPISAKMGFFYL